MCFRTLKYHQKWLKYEKNEEEIVLYVLKNTYLLTYVMLISALMESDLSYKIGGSFQYQNT